MIKNCKAIIDGYVEAVKKVEGQAVKYYKLNQDGEIYDGLGQMTAPGNPRGMTLMFVSEMPNDATEHLTCESSRNKIIIGDIMMMDGNMLKVDGKVPSHNFWFFKFATMFEADLKCARFVELRPKRH